MPKHPKYYVVWKGRAIGIFDSWDECAAQVSGFPDAEYKAFESLSAAEEAFRGKYEDYKGKFTSALSPEELRRIGQPDPEGIAVDASCIGYPGPVEYRGVRVGSRRRQVFHQGPFPHGTNNIGEFLGIVHALALLAPQPSGGPAHNGQAAPVYSDSETAIAWVTGRRCRTKMERSPANDELFTLIERAELWLNSHTFENAVLKWETQAWGENPADFGRK